MLGSRTGGGILSRHRRDEIERELKRILLWNARDGGVDLDELVEWLYYAVGVRVRRDWCDVEKKVLKSKELTARELASFLASEGINVDEEAWIELLESCEKEPVRGGKRYRGSFCVDL